MSRVIGATDERFMRRAIELAERALGETNPNPAVGCVLVKRGKIVGEGFHARAGGPHAEAAALAAAGARAQGATAYVTLEPCAPNPAKRTPPCAPRLIEAGVARVVAAVRDANPHVRGAGVRMLRAAGVEVVEGVLAEESRLLTRNFNVAMHLRRPFVTLKAGMTLDGRIATATGESRWITSKKQRDAARNLRRYFDGVLVGYETAIQDNPILLPGPRTARPYTRVVLDSHLRLPRSSRLVKSARRNPLILIGGDSGEPRRRGLEASGVDVILVPTPGGRVSLAAALGGLFDRGLTSLMVEGGSEVMGSFVREQLFDELVIFRAPLILGGRGSRAVVGGRNPRTLSEGVKVRRATIETSPTIRYGLEHAGDLEVEVYERKA